ncbi:NADPH:quinone reductase [Microlunatus endophyticus]|uniref:NADPH:quinone reductase n=1 Tax=Microlunatus endophyticus TaxID=1716077 RepID=A0A917S5S9_9ACTN|nr:zinc-binding alcohol dehydrogenase family protein [Microlunatus endophyticus]GGL56678.1 NADPH:quinone reductase [Microlunatus endophyticus]
MKAAVVYEAGRPPAYREFADPQPAEGEETVEILAAGLHNITRSQASGQHYAAHGQLPMIPGIDGVARRADGNLIYIGGLKPPYGTFAERAVVTSWALPVPADADPAVIAASLNPGGSGWMALTLRAELQPGQTVAVLGATGAAGRTALQAARLLGAGRVIAIGRSASALEQIADRADQVVRITTDGGWAEQLDGRPDIVLDYTWGDPAAQLLPVLSGRNQGGRLTWVQIGSIAGRSLPLAADLLRSNDLHLIGSGLGSAPMRDMAAQLPAVIDHVAAGRIGVEPVVRRLADVENAWDEPVPTGRRMVFVP